MSEELIVYGFGSYFNGSSQQRDIDLLIVHQSGDYSSCRFAIQCKRFLVLNLVKPDITMLSGHEERQISFVAKSNALHIGTVREASEEADLGEILRKIGQPNN